MKIGNIILPQLPKGARLRADNELARRERDTALSDVE